MGKWNIGLTSIKKHRMQILEGLTEYFKIQENRNQHSEKLREYYRIHSPWKPGRSHAFR